MIFSYIRQTNSNACYHLLHIKRLINEVRNFGTCKFCTCPASNVILHLGTMVRLTRRDTTYYILHSVFMGSVGSILGTLVLTSFKDMRDIALSIVLRNTCLALCLLEDLL